MPNTQHQTNPASQKQNQGGQDQYSDKNASQTKSEPDTSRVGNNMEKDEPAAQGGNTGGMKNAGNYNS